jgi:hypothetical protein
MKLGHDLPGFYPSVEPCLRQDRELSDQTLSSIVRQPEP